MPKAEVRASTPGMPRPPTFASERMMQRGVFETRFGRQVTAEVATAVGDDLIAQLEPTERLLVWFVDASAVTGFSTDLGPAGTALVRRLRERGLEHLVIVLTNGAVRMMAKAISLASSTKMQFFETRAEAFAHLIKTVLPSLPRL